MYRLVLPFVIAILFGQVQSDAAEQAEKPFSVHPIGQVQKKDGET